MKLLEELNLYYNCLSNKDELKRLVNNTSLKNVDLRLNPVTRNESDYRLYLIHLLPSLRRLDDRTILDNERQAALMHFTTEHATEFKDSIRLVSHLNAEKTNKRANHVKSLAKPPLVRDDNDAKLLDFVNQPNAIGKISGSGFCEPSAKVYSRESIAHMNIHGWGSGDEPTNRITYYKKEFHDLDEESISETEPEECSNALHEEKLRNLQEKYPNITIMKKQTNFNKHPFTEKTSRIDFTNPDDRALYTDYDDIPANGVNTDQFEKESLQSYADHPAFFNPRSADISNAYEAESFSDENQHDDNEHLKLNNKEAILFEETNNNPNKSENSMTYHQNGNVSYVETIKIISDLCDKYWNGCNSLLKNDRFTAQMHTLLQTHYGSKSKDSTHRTIEQLEIEVQQLLSDNKTLQEEVELMSIHSPHQSKIDEIDEKSLKSTLQKTQRDLNILRAKLKASLNENKKLQTSLLEYDSQQDITSRSISSQNKDDRALQLLRSENENLKKEIEELLARDHRTKRIENLTKNLQNNQQSLMLTNAELMKEIQNLR